MSFLIEPTINPCHFVNRIQEPPGLVRNQVRFNVDIRYALFYAKYCIDRNFYIKLKSGSILV
jgi:hypothetical protein